MATPRKTVPARTIKASEFKATCLELMDEVAARQVEIVVTKHGKPVAKLASVETVPPNPWGFLRGTVLRQGDLVQPDLAAWRPSSTDPLE
jgi:prevent-host-death family protein